MLFVEQSLLLRWQPAPFFFYYFLIQPLKQDAGRGKLCPAFYCLPFPVWLQVQPLAHGLGGKWQNGREQDCQVCDKLNAVIYRVPAGKNIVVPCLPWFVCIKIFIAIPHQFKDLPQCFLQSTLFDSGPRAGKDIFGSYRQVFIRCSIWNEAVKIFLDKGKVTVYKISISPKEW